MQYQPEPESGIVTTSESPRADADERVEPWHAREFVGAPSWLLAVAAIAVVVVPAIAFYMSAA